MHGTYLAYHQSKDKGLRERTDSSGLSPDLQLHAILFRLNTSEHWTGSLFFAEKGMGDNPRQDRLEFARVDGFGDIVIHARRQTAFLIAFHRMGRHGGEEPRPDGRGITIIQAA